MSGVAVRLQAGFTLLELIVAVVIVAILASIALPAYNDYVVRGKIPQAASNLAALRVQVEQFYQDNQTYAGACDTLPAADSFNYTCPADTLTATTYTAKATGLGMMSNFAYTIDQDNRQMTVDLPDGWGTVPADCWITKRGHTC